MLYNKSGVIVLNVGDSVQIGSCLLYIVGPQTAVPLMDPPVKSPVFPGDTHPSSHIFDARLLDQPAIIGFLMFSCSSPVSVADLSLDRVES